ncbi:MAG: hypothetical protein M3N98_02740 [Actinomycetota bacterium]|nr:hypothetical protein [Actinomycetota bacterium]
MADPPWRDKVSDDDLQRFAGGQSGCRSVLVEVAIPRARAEIGVVARPGNVQPLPLRLAGTTRAADPGALVATARSFLTGVLGVDPVWLDAAACFVADVTGAQLQAIVASPLVRAIHPNRHLR